MAPHKKGFMVANQPAAVVASSPPTTAARVAVRETAMATLYPIGLSRFGGVRESNILYSAQGYRGFYHPNLAVRQKSKTTYHDRAEISSLLLPDARCINAFLHYTSGTMAAGRVSRRD